MQKYFLHKEKITTTLDSNTAFLGEKPTHKGNFPHFAWEIPSALDSHPCCYFFFVFLPNRLPFGLDFALD
ncbi:MAG: hypothetical protein AABX78_01285 [Nanoarchaeota archaeon]